MLAALLLTLLPVQAPALPPALQERIECEDELRAFALDAKGMYVVTVVPKTFALAAWSLADGKALWSVEDGGVRWVELCDKGTSLLCGFVMHAVSEYDPKDGKRRSAIGGPVTEGRVSAFAADPEGRWVWLGMEQGLMRLTPGDVNGWSRRKLEGGGVTALALDGAGSSLAAGCRDGAVRFANGKSASVDEKKVFAGQDSAITALAFASKALVAAAEDGSVRVWTLASGKEKHVLASSGPAVGALAALPKAGWVASGDAQGTIVLWDVERGTELARWSVEGGAPIHHLAFRERERVLYVAAGRKLLSVALSDLK